MMVFVSESLMNNLYDVLLHANNPIRLILRFYRHSNVA